jgi:hypothetical protein
LRKGHFIALIAIELATSAVHAAQPSPGHPLVGTWTYTRSEGACVERYRFDADGHFTLGSGPAVVEGSYQVTAKPVVDNFYRVTETILKENLQPDCSGASVELGRASVSYLQFDPPHDMFVRCQSPSLASCIGPLMRQPESGR